LPELYDYLAEYLYEIYDTIEHPALGQAPRDAYQRGLGATGARPHRQIADDLEFQILTLPTTKKGTAKSAPGRGVKINHVYYWSESLRDPSFEHRQVGVRYDPFDAGLAYVFAGRWVQCHSECYLALRGHSEKKSHSQARSYAGGINAILRNLKSPLGNWPSSWRRWSLRKRSFCKDSAIEKAVMCVTGIPA